MRREKSSAASARAALAVVAVAALLGGCAYQGPVTAFDDPGTVEAPAAAVPGTHTVAYPGGRYELHGAGTPESPHFWVWVPEGATVTAPPPPPLPGAPPAPPSSRGFIYHSDGRYELRGDGTRASPHYWVWVPTGAARVAEPAPPPAPTVVVIVPAERVRHYAGGRYELFGQGTAASPHYWVWVPEGASPPPPPPLPRRVQAP